MSADEKQEVILRTLFGDIDHPEKVYDKFISANGEVTYKVKQRIVDQAIEKVNQFRRRKYSHDRDSYLSCQM